MGHDDGFHPPNAWQIVHGAASFLSTTVHQDSASLPGVDDS